MVQVLLTLGHETRLEAFKRLVEAGDDGMSAGALSEALGVPPSSLTYHLKELKQANLATSRREHRQQIYAVRYDTMRDLLGSLMDNCCGGRPEICDPRWGGAGDCKPPEGCS